MKCNCEKRGRPLNAELFIGFATAICFGIHFHSVWFGCGVFGFLLEIGSMTDAIWHTTDKHCADKEN